MSYQVKGHVRRTDDNQGINGLSVKAWDVDIATDDFLGEAVTDENGHFEIEFEKDAFSPGWPLALLEGGPDIQIKVLNTWGDLIHTSDKIQGAPAITTVDILIDPKLLEKFTEPETMEICADQPTPDDWVTINYRTSWSKCGGGSGIEDNVKLIQKYVDQPVGESIWVCSGTDCLTPDDWVTINYRTSWSKCGGGSGIEDNIKLILRYDGLPVGESIWVCSGTDNPTPDGWVVIDYGTRWGECRGGPGIEDNIKLIQKIEVARALPISASNVQITNILYDGLVPRVESDEYVEITNLGTEPQDLAGWVLKDVAEGYPSFTFPQSVLKPRETIRVYTNEIHLLWGGFSFGYGRAIWNNKEPDTAALYNAQGEERSRKSYSV